MGFSKEFADGQGIGDLNVQLWGERDEDGDKATIGIFLCLQILLEQAISVSKIFYLAQLDSCEFIWQLVSL